MSLLLSAIIRCEPEKIQPVVLLYSIPLTRRWLPPTLKGALILKMPERAAENLAVAK